MPLQAKPNNDDRTVIRLRCHVRESNEKEKEVVVLDEEEEKEEEKEESEEEEEIDVNFRVRVEVQDRKKKGKRLRGLKGAVVNELKKIDLERTLLQALQEILQAAALPQAAPQEEATPELLALRAADEADAREEAMIATDEGVARDLARDLACVMDEAHSQLIQEARAKEICPICLVTPGDGDIMVRCKCDCRNKNDGLCSMSILHYTCWLECARVSLSTGTPLISPCCRIEIPTVIDTVAYEEVKRCRYCTLLVCECADISCEINKYF